MAGGRGRDTLPAHPLKRHRRVLLLTLAGLVIGWAIAAAVVFVWPPESSGAAKADAVIVLAGGRAARLKEGLALVRGGAAPVLVISDAWSPAWPEANRLCAGRKAPVPILCFHPDPYDTHGEAKGFSSLAKARGWDSVIVVSSRYHTVRAKLLFDRCFDGQVSTDGAGESLFDRVLAAPFETVKMGYALLVRRSC